MIFTLVSAAGSTYVYLGGSIPVNAATLPNADLLTDPLMPDLEETADTGIFSDAYDDEVKGAEADFNNLELTIVVSLILITRIHKNYPKKQIIGDALLALQTRRMTKTSQEHAMVYRNTKDERGIVVRNKASLVAQGYTQEEGIDIMRLVLLLLEYKPSASRPDIMFAVYACARFQVTPNVSHLHAVKRIFRYLKGQPKLGLWYPRDSPFNLEAFSDSDYARASLNRKFIIGESEGFKQIVDFLNANAIKCAFTVSPTIYTSCIKQFWTSAKVKIVNEDVWLQALVDEKKVIVNEASIRCDLRSDDDEGTACLPNAAIFKELARMGTVYVDDIIFGSTKKSLCDEFEQMMHKRFQMSFMRELTFFLRLHVKQEDDGIFISQNKYVADSLKKFDSTSMKTTSTLMEPNKTLIKDAEAKDIDVHLYRSIIRSLMYLIASRPDIMLAIYDCTRDGICDEFRVQAEVSTAEPKTPPTTITLFDEEDVTIANTLVNMKNQKAKEKGIAFKDADDSTRPIKSITTLQPLPTIDPKDKGKGILQVSKPIKKTKKKNQDQLKRDAKGSEKDEKRIRSRKKRAEGLSSKHKSPKKQKVNDQESDDSDKELRKWLKVVSDDDKVIENETLDVKSPIVDCESQVLGTNQAGDVHGYKLTRLNGSYRHFSTFSRMLEVLDREDELDLHKINMERFLNSDPEEKRYLLTKEILEKMLSLRLEAETESTFALDLIKFIKLQIKEKPSDTPVCYLCTCEQCGNILSYGTCLNCNSGTRNSFTYDPIPESFDEVQVIPDPPPQCHFNIYLCQICESNSHYEKIFSNPLFEEEIIPMKIDQHHDNAESTHNSSLIISSKIDSLLYEFVGIDETDYDPEEDIRIIERLLYDNSSPRPPKELVSENSDAKIESFSPSPIPIKDIDSFMEEIDLSFTPDDPMPPGIEEDDYDTERDIIREELLDNYSLSLPVNELFRFDIPLFFHPPAKPPDEVSTAEPKTPPTTITLFDDKDVTIANTLVKMKNQKAKIKGIAFKDANDSTRPTKSITTLQPLLIIDPKDKDDDKVIDNETLDVKSPIVDCESQVLGTNEASDVHVYKLTILNGSYKHFSTFSRMLEVFDREDVLDLHKIIIERFPDSDPEGYDLIL
nr:ribonuclease H-like domain, reverse transcriptase, RNA-dependent DNA polymerase [Tanacetum cinerariifolium]